MNLTLANIISDVARPSYETGLPPSEFAHRIRGGGGEDDVLTIARPIIARAKILARLTGGRVCWGPGCGLDRHWVLAQCPIEDDIASHSCEECGAYTPGPETYRGLCRECSAALPEVLMTEREED